MPSDTPWACCASELEPEKARPDLSLSAGSLQSISFGVYTFDCTNDCTDAMCEIVGPQKSTGTLRAVSMLRCAGRITKMSPPPPPFLPAPQGTSWAHVPLCGMVTPNLKLHRHFEGAQIGGSLPSGLDALTSLKELYVLHRAASTCDRDRAFCDSHC